MFLQDGKIEAEVKLTGVLSLGALQPGESRKYGTMIAPSLYAPVHQHFFIARMDMEVDCKPGEAFNQVYCLKFCLFSLGHCLIIMVYMFIRQVISIFVSHHYTVNKVFHITFLLIFRLLR